MSNLLSDTPVPVLFGEALVDAFASGDVPGGAPFNVARHLGALGFRPLFITRIGQDARGEALLRELGRHHLSIAGVQQDAAHGSGLVTVDETSAGTHAFHIHSDAAWDHIDADQALAALRGLDGTASIFYYGTLAQRSRASRAAAQALLAEAGNASNGWCDLNWRAGHVAPDQALSMLHAAHTAKLNEQELQMVLSWCGLETIAANHRPDAGAAAPAVARLMAQGRLQRLVVTYGSQGFAAFDRSGTCIAAGAGLPLARLTDTVGAGDAFTAISLAGALAGWPLQQTLERANQFAAAICGERGAAPASLDFYQPWRDAWSLN